MATQRDAAKLYEQLQADAAAQAEAFQRAVDADWYRRHPDERPARIGQLQAHLNAEDRSRMGAVVWIVGAACLGLLAFVLPWAALVQWAATGDTGRYVLTLLAFGALILGGLVWRAWRARK